MTTNEEYSYSINDDFSMYTDHSNYFYQSMWMTFVYMDLDLFIST